MIRSKVFKASVFCFLILILPASSFAQYDLKGILTDAVSGESVVNAEIYDNAAGKSFRTDKEGVFVIKGLPEDDYAFYIFKLGYDILNIGISLRSDTTLSISMRPLSGELSEVAVIDQRNEFFSLKRLREVEGTSIYAGKKTEVVALADKIANVAANNARQIYAQVGGLNIYESNDAGLQLNIGGRGLDPNRSSNFNIRQNGYDISADVLGYPESYYTPPAEALEEIQVIRGAASLQYGTQFGGLVNFVMKKPVRDKQLEVTSRQTTGSNGLFTSFNSLSGTTGDLGYYGYYHKKSGNGFRPNSDFDSDNLYFYTDLEIGQKTTLYADFTYLKYLARQPGGLTDAQFYRDPGVSNRSRNWFEVDWKLASLGLEHRFDYRKRLSWKIYGLDASRKAVGFRTNRVSQTDDLSEPRDLIIGEFRNFGTEAKYLQRYNIGQRNAVFLLGAKYYQSRNASIQGPGSTDSSADFTLESEQFPNYPNQSDFTFPNRNLAIFGEHIFYLSENFSLTPGIRYEFIRTESEGTFKRVNFDLAGNPIQNDTFSDNRTFERSFLLAGIGLSYIPGKQFEAYGNLSRNYRSVTFNDIRIVNPTFQVDPDIRDESGYTADLGIRGQITSVINYDINSFGIWYNDRLGEVLQPEVRINAEGEPEETGRIVRFRGNIGTAFMYGLETQLEWNISGSLGLSEKKVRLSSFINTAFTRSEYLDSGIPGVERNQVEFTPLINLKTGLTAGYKNLLASIQYTFLSDQYTDASNAAQNINDNQSGIRGEIPAYDVMDLSLSWSVSFFKMETGVNNLLNNLYFTRRATGYPGPGIIPSPPRTWYFTLQARIGK